MLIKKRFLNTRLKAVAGLMTAAVIIGGSLVALPIDNAKGAGSPYPPTDSEYEKVWSDEFNGDSLDTNVWSPYVGGWNASAVQGCYKDSPENINVSGGSLNLIGLHKPGVTCNKGKNKDFTSGFVETKDKKAWTYGYFEARIKMPNNKSTWPAFWMSPNESAYGSWPRSGEIDIVETKGSNLDYAAADAHWGISPGYKKHAQGKKLPAGFKDTTQWHTYGVKWTEGKLEYYIDGVKFHTVSSFGWPNAANTPYGPFDKPFFLRLNLAIGGDYIDGNGSKWSNAYNALAEYPKSFPATMSVDYVRVYERRTAKEVNVPDNNLRAQLNKKLSTVLSTNRKDDQKITDVELEKLTDLNLDAADNASEAEKIHDLTGLEAAKNLKSLSLKNNSVFDLRAVSNIKSLKSINLTINR